MKKIIRIKSSWEHLVVFDFDKTLADTEECVLVRDIESDRIVDHLQSQTELNNYILDAEKHYYDFTEYNSVSNFAKPIKETLDLMKEFLVKEETKVIVLTARHNDSKYAIEDFLSKQGIDTKDLFIFGTSGSSLKLGHLQNFINRFNISKSILIFEDSLENIKSFINLEYHNPELSFEYVQVMPKELIGEDLEEAKKYPYKAEYGTEKYQRALKRVHPAMKRKLIGLGGNSYSTTGVKKVKDFVRSKSAPPMG